MFPQSSAFFLARRKHGVLRFYDLFVVSKEGYKRYVRSFISKKRAFQHVNNIRAEQRFCEKLFRWVANHRIHGLFTAYLVNFAVWGFHGYRPMDRWMLGDPTSTLFTFRNYCSVTHPRNRTLRWFESYLLDEIPF